MSGTNEAIVRRWIDEAINEGNLKVADELVSRDYVWHGPGQEVRGIDGLKQLVTVYRTAFPDLVLKADEIVEVGDKVITRWSCRGTHKGELAGVQPTGKPINIGGIVITRIVDGKLAEDWEQFDQFNMFQQLGVLTIAQSKAAGS